MTPAPASRTAAGGPTGSRPATAVDTAFDAGVDLPAQDPDTVVPTQWQRPEDDYLDARSDIGRAVGNHTRELFVSGDADRALHEQFEHLRPRYIALHDIACLASRHLLQAVAAAAGQPLQRLVIRRQGYGTTLGVLDYLDCPTDDHGSVRIYATDADDADTGVRHALARVLLCRSTLALVMVGDVPVHALNEPMQPLRNAMFSTDWECRDVVFLPLALGPVKALTNLALALGAGAGVHTEVGPIAHRPADAWAMLTKAWNAQQLRLHPSGEGAHRLPPVAPTRDALRPMPAHRPGAEAPAAAQPRRALERLAEELLHQPGVTAACIFELTTSKVLAAAGVGHDPVDLARRGTLLMTAANTSRRLLGLGESAEELLIKGGEYALGLRQLRAMPGLVLHLVYRPAQSDWAQLRPRIMALDAALPRSPVI